MVLKTLICNALTKAKNMSSAKYFIWFIHLFLFSYKLVEQCDEIVNSMSTKFHCNCLNNDLNIWLNTNSLSLIYRTKESAVQLATALSVYTLIPNLITLALTHPEIFGVCEPVDYVSIAVRISCIAHYSEAAVRLLAFIIRKINVEIPIPFFHGIS